MASNFEQLVFEIIATDKNASAAFDRFRQKVDATSRSVDDSSKTLDKNSKSVDSFAKRVEAAVPLLGNLAGSGGIAGGGMGALIGAGVALSPVIATVGLGIGGLGLAAAGVVAPILKAAQSAGGLQANMAKLDPEQRKLATSLLGLGKQYSAFEKSLAPQVLGIFNKGIQIAGNVMGDLQPIARSTGVALEQVLGRIDAEFRSGNWQKFFSWMAANAGPDVRLLGDSFLRLLDALPQVLIDLQPIATLILQVTAAVAKVVGPIAEFIHLAEVSNQAQFKAARSADSWAVSLTNSIPGLKAVNDSITADQNALRGWLGQAQPATAAAKNLGTVGQSVAAQMRSLSTGVDVSQQSFSSLVHPLNTATVGIFGVATRVAQAKTSFSGLVHPVNAAGDGFLSLAGKTAATKDNFNALTHPLDTVAGGIFAAGSNAKGTTEHFNTLGSAAKATAGQVNTLTTAMNNNAIATLTLQGDQVAWRLALQAANKQLSSNSAGLRGNSANALANKQAVIGTTNAAISFASAQLKLHGNLQAASLTIQAQIRWLQQHGDKSAFAAREIGALRAEEALIKKQIASKVTVTGRGSWSVTAQAHALAQGPSNPNGAAGLLVRGGIPGRDSVLINAMPGELLVPVKMVQAGAVDHLRGSIPGFAGGGVVPSYSGGANKAQGQWAVGNWDANILGLERAVASATYSGMRAAAARAASTAAFKGKFGAGVAQWRGDVLQVLRMLGLPLGDAGTILAQMATESGGNPNAINLTDSNAQMGDPSRGLMQTIMSTFEAYRSRSLPNNIYNPLANIYAGVNYAIHRYGNPGFLSVLGHGHGYDSGGWLPPGASLAYNGTGQPEQVLAPGSMARVEMLLTQILAATRVAPAATSVGMTRALNGMVPR